MSNGIFSWKL